jgi:hypothetical protein
VAGTPEAHPEHKRFGRSSPGDMHAGRRDEPRAPARKVQMLPETRQAEIRHQEPKWIDTRTADTLKLRSVRRGIPNEDAYLSQGRANR